MKITAILAMTQEGVIGNDNSLLWNLPEDMKRFREITSHHTVIMGKNTYFSLPAKFRPLPNRRNIVFTRGSIEGVECVQDFSELQKLLQNEKKTIFLIGGAQMYDYFFENNLIDVVELTLVNGDYKGDIRVKDFRENFSEIHRQSFSDGYFITLHKK